MKAAVVVEALVFVEVAAVVLVVVVSVKAAVGFTQRSSLNRYVKRSQRYITKGNPRLIDRFLSVSLFFRDLPLFSPSSLYLVSISFSITNFID